MTLFNSGALLTLTFMIPTAFFGRSSLFWSGFDVLRCSAVFLDFGVYERDVVFAVSVTFVA